MVFRSPPVKIWRFLVLNCCFTSSQCTGFDLVNRNTTLLGYIILYKRHAIAGTS